MKKIIILLLILGLFMGNVRATWVKVWLEEGDCGEATFYSGDTVYFYLRAERDCNATIILETPWKVKVLKEKMELKACGTYRSYFDIGTGITRSDWWRIVVEVKDGSGNVAKAECSFYVPIKKPTPPPSTPSITTPPSTTPSPTTTTPPTTIPQSTTPPSTTPSPTTPTPPTTTPASTVPESPKLPVFSPPPKNYAPIFYAGVLAAIVISVMMYLLITKRP